MLFSAGEQQAAKQCAETHFSWSYIVMAELVFLTPFTANGEKCAHAGCYSSEVFYISALGWVEM